MSESEINRRAMLARLGLAATAIYTVPAITTLSAAHASSPSGGDSSPSEDDNSSPSEDDTSGPSDDESSASAESTCGKKVVGAVCN